MDSQVTSNRICNLPCNLITYILNFLTLRDAARTSVLSRDWRYRWLTIPSLVFDKNFFIKIPSKEKQNVESIIYQMMILHKGSIHKFKLDADYPVRDPAINNWIHFLSNHHIREFDLTSLWERGNDYRNLSSHLFNFEHLTCLRISGFKFKPPLAFKGFSRLVTLELIDAKVASDQCSSFISSCPLLEHLKMHECKKIEDLDIVAPNLVSLDFVGLFRSIRLRNTPVLAEVSISNYSRDGKQTQECALIFGHPSSITRLELKHHVPRVKLPDNFDHLKAFHYSGIDYKEVPEISFVVCLIKSAPKLESLQIKVGDIRTTKFPSMMFHCIYFCFLCLVRFLVRLGFFRRFRFL